MAKSRAAPIPLKQVETKHDKFVRLLNQRAKPVIRYLRMIGQLGSRDYEYTSDEIDQIEAALNSEVAKTIAALRRPDKPGDVGNILQTKATPKCPS